MRKRNENQPVDFIKYIKQAAEADQTSSQYEYCVALFNGIGVEQNVRDWTNFIIKAADKGDSDAQFFIAREKETGERIEKDNEEAEKYYRMASEKRTHNSSLQTRNDALEWNSSNTRCSRRCSNDYQSS